MRSINQQAPVRCRKSITISADPQKVWTILTAIDQWPNWQPAISQAKLAGTLQAGSTFAWKIGGVKIHSTLHTVEPPHQFGWTGRTFGLFAIHNWTLTTTGQDTTVEVEESMEGWLATLFQKTFQKNLEKDMQTWLELLQAACIQ